jgi:hypothetical protein
MGQDMRDFAELEASARGKRAEEALERLAKRGGCGIALSRNDCDCQCCQLWHAAISDERRKVRGG